MKNLKISPENKMDPEMLKEIDPESRGIIQIEEGRIAPLYIFIANIRAPKMGNTKINYMMTASHLKKTNEIEIKGRLRYEATGRKTVFSLKENFKLNELDKAKGKIKEMYTVLRNKMWLIEISPAVEINFGANESIDSIIKKMDESGEFDIGITPKK